MKKIISVLLALVFVLSSFAVLAYADKKEEKLGAYIVLDDGNDTTTERLVNAYEIDGEYYFFVPASMNKYITKFVVSSNNEKVSINGKEIAGLTTVADAFGDKTEITVTVGDNSYTVKAIFGSAIPNVYIETPSGSLDYIHADKSNRQDCLIEITDALGVTVYDGGVEVKGRGNSTWKMEKKPYNIKLDEKVNLFGMGKSKKWSLIANHTDLSLIRNAYVYSAAKAAGLDFVPEYVPCDLYIDNEYMGNYILTSRVEVDKTRVNIDNLEDANEEANPDIDIEEDCKTGGTYGTFAGLLEGTSKWIEIPNEPEEISGGYILEMEISNRYKDEASGFVTKIGQPFIMKSPEFASRGEIEYISKYYQDFEDAVITENGKNEAGKHYSEYIDVDSFAEYYAFNEWTSNMDCGLTSTYLYKPVNDVFYAGPVWDYDIALGNNDIGRFGCDYTNPEEFTVCFGRQYRNTIFDQKDYDRVPTLFNTLCQKQEFVDKAKSSWDSTLKNAIVLTNAAMPAYIATVTDSAVMNALRWNIFDTYDEAEIRKAYKAETDGVLDFSSKRVDFLSANFGTIQVQDVEIGFFEKIEMKIGSFINNMFEKMIVTFGLKNIF